MIREETWQKKTALSSNQISWFLFVKSDSETILKTELEGNTAGCSDGKSKNPATIPPGTQTHPVMSAGSQYKDEKNYVS